MRDKRQQFGGCVPWVPPVQGISHSSNSFSLIPHRLLGSAHCLASFCPDKASQETVLWLLKLHHPRNTVAEN